MSDTKSNKTVPLDPFLQLNSLCRFLTNYSDGRPDQKLSDEDLADFRMSLGDFFYSPVNAEYLQKYASHDMLVDINFDELFNNVEGPMRRKSNYELCENVKKAANLLIDVILEKVENGNAVLVAMMARFRFGYVNLHLKHDPGVMYNRMAIEAEKNKSPLYGHMISHTLLKQGVENILKCNHYTADAVAHLAKHIPQRDMIRLGSPSIKRHLISNDLSL